MANQKEQPQHLEPQVAEQPQPDPSLARVNALSIHGQITFPRAEAVRGLLLHFYRETRSLPAAIDAAKKKANVDAYLGSGKPDRHRVERLVLAGAKISEVLAGTGKIPRAKNEPEKVDTVEFLLLEELLKSGKSFQEATEELASLDGEDQEKEVALMFVKAGESTASAKSAAFSLCPKENTPNGQAIPQKG